MKKSWLQSIVYFINVIFHITILWILFTVAIPDNCTIQEFVLDVWRQPEGKEMIITNAAFIVGNLIFAFIIAIYVNKSLFNSKVLAFLAWVFVLVLYLFGTEGIIFSYILGAIGLTAFSYNKYKMPNNTFNTDANKDSRPLT